MFRTWCNVSNHDPSTPFVTANGAATSCWVSSRQPWYIVATVHRGHQVDRHPDRQERARCVLREEVMHERLVLVLGQLLSELLHERGVAPIGRRTGGQAR